MLYFHAIGVSKSIGFAFSLPREMDENVTLSDGTQVSIETNFTAGQSYNFSNQFTLQANDILTLNGVNPDYNGELLA